MSLLMTHIEENSWANCKTALWNCLYTHINFFSFRIVVTVALLAESVGCYKMTLECKDSLIPFYKSLGYIFEPGNSNSMKMRYTAAIIILKLLLEHLSNFYIFSDLIHPDN